MSQPRAPRSGTGGHPEHKRYRRPTSKKGSAHKGNAGMDNRRGDWRAFRSHRSYHRHSSGAPRREPATSWRTTEQTQKQPEDSKQEAGSEGKCEPKPSRARRGSGTGRGRTAAGSEGQRGGEPNAGSKPKATNKRGGAPHRRGMGGTGGDRASGPK